MKVPWEKGFADMRLEERTFVLVEKDYPTEQYEYFGWLVTSLFKRIENE